MLPDPSSWAYVPAVIAASIAIGYLLGSVSHKVTGLAPCPVMVV